LAKGSWLSANGWFSVSLHNLWPKRWVGYDRVGAGLFGFSASIWDTRLANRFVLTTFLAWFDGAAPGENQCVC
jgi:hypothetical protein